MTTSLAISKEAQRRQKAEIAHRYDTLEKAHDRIADLYDEIAACYEMIDDRGCLIADLERELEEIA